MNNTAEYDKIAYKKYEAYCRLNREEMREMYPDADIDFQLLSFDGFLKKIKEDTEFSKVWGYWNFV